MIEAIRNLLSIGRATRVDDTGELQLLQVTEGAAGNGFKDRIREKVRRVTDFGFASNPPVGAEVLILNRDGDRTKPIVIGTSHRPSRQKNLAAGETVIFDVRGQRVYISAGGILIDGNGANLPVTIRNVPKLRVEATQIECTGDLVAYVDGTAISLKALHDAYNAHRHGGVAGGSATTGLSDHLA